MSEELYANLLSVGEIFDDSHAEYEVPLYQRNFAWKMEQIEQLIDDIWAASSANDESYFLGNLVVSKRKSENRRPENLFEVIDGQQRLTTLYLLLTALDVTPQAQLSYQSRPAATAALAGLGSSEDEDGSGINTAVKNINARLARFDELGSGVAERAKFKIYLQTHVVLVRAELPPTMDLNRYFEIMNTRGQQLEQVDIVKARLMSYLAGADMEDARECFAWIWDACADMESYIQLALTRGDTKLRTTIFGKTWDSLVDFTFGSLLLHRRETGLAQETAPLGSATLSDAIERYSNLGSGEARDDLASERFESPIRFPNLLLQTLLTMRRSDSEHGSKDDSSLDDSRLIKLFETEFESLDAASKNDRTRLCAESLLCAKFTLDNYVLKREFTSTNGSDGAWSLRRLVKSTSEGKRNATYVNSYGRNTEHDDDEALVSQGEIAEHEALLLQSMLRVTYTSSRTMHWITEILRLGPETARSELSVRNVLRSYARTKVQEAFFAGEIEPTGFGIERIVFTYLDYLLAIDDQNQSKQPLVFGYRNSVEHFFPQHPDHQQENWDRLGGTGKEPAVELNLLGNLALVYVGTNSKFSNNMPEQKASFPEILKQSPKLQLMAKDAKATSWGKEQIRTHHAQMVELLRKDIDMSEQS